MDDELIVGRFLDLDAERAHGGDRRLGVRRTPESVHERLVLAERADQGGTVGDRLVAGHGDVPDQRSGGLDLHSSRTGDVTTW